MKLKYSLEKAVAYFRDSSLFYDLYIQSFLDRICYFSISFVLICYFLLPFLIRTQQRMRMSPKYALHPSGSSPLLVANLLF